MGTLVVGLVVLAIVVAAARSIWKDKKNGKSCGSCGGGCGGCSKCKTKLIRITREKDMILEKFRNRGMRITKQRRLILDIVFEQDCTSCKRNLLSGF